VEAQRGTITFQLSVSSQHAIFYEKGLLRRLVNRRLVGALGFSGWHHAHTT
jgi:hypothetical protein